MRAGGSTGLICCGHSKISYFEKVGVCRLDGHWEANYKLWPNPIGYMLLFTQLLLYVGIYLVDNPVINGQKKIVKSQVLKFHQKIGKRIGIIWLFVQLITVSISTLGTYLKSLMSGLSPYHKVRCGNCIQFLVNFLIHTPKFSFSNGTKWQFGQ